MSRPGFVYIMTKKRNGTLYIGCTSDLAQRVWQHRNGVVEGFTKNTNSTASFGSSPLTTSKMLANTNFG